MNEDVLRQLIARWRAEADELDAATNGSWVEPGVKRQCADELEALLAERPPPQDAPNWQPMDTAPEDGTHVVVRHALE